MNISRFDSTKIRLHNLLTDIKTGKIQLPDFQRGWVWDDYRILSLIASVSQAFPIGSVLTLEAGGTDVRFKTRLIEGVNREFENTEPETLILDGQQRLTALFQTLMSESYVLTKNTQGKDSLRYYYFDMKRCIEDNIEREDAVYSCGGDNHLQVSDQESIDLSLPENQYKHYLFPVHEIFESADWRRKYNKYWEYDNSQMDLFDKFESKIIDCFRSYDVPVIHLLKETPREAVCLVFEKVNTRGMTLTVFELLTATFAASEYPLRENWEEREQRLKEHAVLEELESTSFLRALTLLSTNANPNTPVSCTRREILRLTVPEYKRWANQVESGFERAVRFLHSLKIFNARDLPYHTHLVPLAAIFADLGEKIEPGMDAKIAQWFWCGVFGEMYGASTDTRFANDYSEVTAWVKGKQDLPRTIREANFHENRLLELKTRNSAAYKGVHALLMHNNGCRDFRTGETIELQRFFNDNIDIHHIFPKKWCEEHGILKENYNCIVNKTALSSRTNRMIGGRAPSEYLRSLNQDQQKQLTLIDNYPEKYGPDTNEILNSHCINADSLRKDDFDQFFTERKEALINAIQIAMDKKVNRENAETQVT